MRRHCCRQGALEIQGVIFGQIENQDLQARQRCGATWKYDGHDPFRRDF